MCNLYITNGTKKKLKNKQNKKHPQFSIGWTNSHTSHTIGGSNATVWKQSDVPCLYSYKNYTQQL